MHLHVSDTAVAGLLAIGLAPFIGSFLGVLIARLPHGAPIAWARSACPQCGTPLTPRDLVPLLSYLRARGRCRHCGGAVARFHLWIELAAMAVAGIAALAMDDPPGVAAACLLGWPLLAAAWIDWEHMLLPDAITLPLLLAGLGASWLRTGDLPVDAALGAAVGYAAFVLLSWAYRRLRGHDGLGGGDAKLLAAGGAWLGWQALPMVVLLAAGAGLLLAAGLRLAGRPIGRTTRLPFGPCLALAIWAAYLAGG